MRFDFQKFYLKNRCFYIVRLPDTIKAQIDKVAVTEKVLFNEAIETLLESSLNEYFQHGKEPEEKQPERVLFTTVEEKSKEEIEEKVIVKVQTQNKKCKHCGKNDRKILGRGLCTKCYFKHRNEYPAVGYSVSRNPSFASKKIRDEIKEKELKEDTDFLNEKQNKYGDEKHFCQNAHCKNGKVMYYKYQMVEREKLFFCSLDCADATMPL